jgi:hypothetical protein
MKRLHGGQLTLQGKIDQAERQLMDKLAERVANKLAKPTTHSK